jgi:hypothetical protein
MEKAFTDLGCMEMNALNYEMFSDVMNYLGYVGEDLH